MFQWCVWQTLRERGRWAWGTPFIDLDGDGWEDMLVGNGYVTSHDTGDL